MDVVGVLRVIGCAEDVVQTVKEGVVVSNQSGIAGYEEYEVAG